MILQKVKRGPIPTEIGSYLESATPWGEPQQPLACPPRGVGYRDSDSRDGYPTGLKQFALGGGVVAEEVALGGVFAGGIGD